MFLKNKVAIVTGGDTASPGLADWGANEGVYVQFETPAEVDSAELTTNVRDASAPFTLDKTLLP
jgi:hypothetical protein